jgi:23S rRNA C2498 (ribose-2'-O)-methylase RlmM
MQRSGVSSLCIIIVQSESFAELLSQHFISLYCRHSVFAKLRTPTKKTSMPLCSILLTISTLAAVKLHQQHMQCEAIYT